MSTTINTATPRGTNRDFHSPAIAGYPSPAIASAQSTHAMTRSAFCAISSSKTVAASANTIARAERTDSRTRTVRVPSAIGSYDTEVALDGVGSPANSSNTAAGPASIDIDPRSAIPIAIAVALLGITVWFVRSIPRTLSAFAIATLLALALNPLVEGLKRRPGWHRRTAATVLLVVFALLASTSISLITAPTIREVRDFNKQIPTTVKDLGKLPVIGPRLREAKASEKVQEWLNDVPKRLSVNSKPIENAA